MNLVNRIVKLDVKLKPILLLFFSREIKLNLSTSYFNYSYVLSSHQLISS